MDIKDNLKDVLRTHLISTRTEIFEALIYRHGMKQSAPSKLL